MNFVLTMIICSATSGTCLPPFQLDNFYKDGTEINITRFVDRSEHLVETINPIKTVLFQYEGRNTILS